MPKDYLVCTLPCLGYFDTSYYCAVLSDQLSQYKPIPRPNFAPESSYDYTGPAPQDHRLVFRASCWSRSAAQSAPAIPAFVGCSPVRGWLRPLVVASAEQCLNRLPDSARSANPRACRSHSSTPII